MAKVVGHAPSTVGTAPTAARRSDPSSRRAAPTALIGDDAALQLLIGVGGGEHARPDAGFGDLVDIARAGTRGAGGALPYLRTIQTAFGRHDVTSVKAHTDGAAVEASRALGATAFATGEHVAFAGTPALHTVAHEAAHVIQQRGGVQLAGGVGAAGDPHERHADAVADAVAAGRPAEALLDAAAPPGGPSGAAPRVQRQPAGEDRFFRGQALPETAPELHKLLEGMIVSTGNIDSAEDFVQKYRFSVDYHRPHVTDAVYQRRTAIANLLEDQLADILGLIDRVGAKAKQILLERVGESEKRVRQEMARYGLTESIEEGWEDSGTGTARRVTHTRYSMKDTADARGMIQAVAELKAKRDQIDQLKRAQATFVGTRPERQAVDTGRDHGRIWEWKTVNVPVILNPPAHAALQQQIDHAEHQYEVMRGEREQRYPIIAGARDPQQLATSASAAALMGPIFADNLRSIAKVRDGDMPSIWKLPRILDAAREALTVAPGSWQDVLINWKVERVQRNELWINLALGVLQLGLAIGAAAFTGGASLVLAAGAFAASGYTAYQAIKEYQSEYAAAHSDFDRARALSAVEPSAFWVVLAVAGAALDFSSAVTAVGKLSRLAHAAVVAKPAATAAEDATLIALRTEAERIVGPARAKQLVDDAVEARAAYAADAAAHDAPRPTGTGAAGSAGGDSAAAMAMHLAGGDQRLAAAAARVKPEAGFFDVVVHGSPDKLHVMHNGAWVELDHRALAGFLKSRGYQGGPVRLIACETGATAEGIAKNLANKLGVEIKAPSDTIWIHPSGDLSIGKTAADTSGKWRTFRPGKAGGAVEEVTAAGAGDAAKAGERAGPAVAAGRKITADERKVIDEYRRVAPSGTLGDAEILAEIRAGKKFDPNTKRFYDPKIGEKPHYTATETPRGEHTVDEFPGKSRKSIDESLAERDQAIKRRDRAKTTEKRDKISAEVNEASREVGDKAAAEVIKKRFKNAQKVYPPPGAGSRSGDFDQVWRVMEGDTEKLVITVEAKGGAGARGGGRRALDGQRAEQGTREYWDSVVEAMSSSSDDAVRAMGRRLRAIPKKDVEKHVLYLKVTTPIESVGGRSTTDVVEVIEYSLKKNKP